MDFNGVKGKCICNTPYDLFVYLFILMGKEVNFFVYGGIFKRYKGNMLLILPRIFLFKEMRGFLHPSPI